MPSSDCPLEASIMAPQARCSSSDDSSDDNSDQRQRRKRNSEGKMSRLEKGTDEYLKRRERNNIAVKKSRNKSKLKMQQTLERVSQLRAENEMLETKIKLLTKELSFLKDLFLAHAGSAHGQHLTDIDISILNNNNEGELDLKNQGVKQEHAYTSHTSQ